MKAENLPKPVREFEQATSYCPLYLAWRIVDEARDYFRDANPGRRFADKLARRAEAVFAKSALSLRSGGEGTGEEAVIKPLSPAPPPLASSIKRREKLSHLVSCLDSKSTGEW